MIHTTHTTKLAAPNKAEKTGSKHHRGRCLQRFTLFIFPAEPPGERSQICKSSHGREGPCWAELCVQPLQAGMHVANRRKALVTTRHPCADIETRKLLLVYTSFLPFSSLKPSFAQTMGAVWPSSASGPHRRDRRSAGALWFALERVFTWVGGSIVLA